MKRAIGKKWDKADAYKWAEHVHELSKASAQKTYYKKTTESATKKSPSKKFEAVKKYTLFDRGITYLANTTKNKVNIYIDTRAHDAMQASIASALKYF